MDVTTAKYNSAEERKVNRKVWLNVSINMKINCTSTSYCSNSNIEQDENLSSAGSDH